MIRFKITKFTHSFKVQVQFQNDKYIVAEFAARLNEYQNVFNTRKKAVEKVYKATYASYSNVTLTYGFLLTLYNDFIDHCNFYKVKPDEISITILPVVIGAPITTELTSSFQLRDYQIPIASFVLENKKLRVLPVQTGIGKSALSLYCIIKLNLRTTITTSAKHLGTWIKEIQWMYLDYADKIFLIKGKKDLVKIIQLAKDNNFHYDIILISNNTLLNYIKEYELLGYSTYGCEPHEFYELLKIGFRIVDEAHEFLHFNVRHTIETNVNKILFLSATIDGNDPFINRIYALLFPHSERYLKLAWDKYTIIKVVSYGLREPNLAMYNGTRGYSHVMYEQWLMKDLNRLENYFKMISNLILMYYHKNYKVGQRLIIYVSTIKMTELLVLHLLTISQLNNYKISEYTGIHEDTVLKEFDIIITTPNKCGSGKDIKGLVMVISTVAVIKKEKTIQMVGRLRSLNDQYPNLDPVYYDLVCSDIPKHLYYTRVKQKTFCNLVKSFQLFKSSYLI